MNLRDAFGFVDAETSISLTSAWRLYAEARGVPAIMVTGSISLRSQRHQVLQCDGRDCKVEEMRIAHATVVLPASRLTTCLPAINFAAREGYLQRYLSHFSRPTFLRGERSQSMNASSVAREYAQGTPCPLWLGRCFTGTDRRVRSSDTEAVRSSRHRSSKTLGN